MSKSKLNFRIVEQKTFEVDMEEFAKDYLNGMTHEKLKEKYQIGGSRLTNLIKQLKKKGIVRPVKNYYYSNDFKKWVIIKTIDKKSTYYGLYDTEEEAKKEVERLRKCNWVR